MKRPGYLKIFMLLISAISIPAHAAAQDADKTLSPYFFIPEGDSGADLLPPESTRAEVKIAGVIADVAVSQVYKNAGKAPIEAIYVFPASTRAAVYGMKMVIGERKITAKIDEREKARRDYETAREQGKPASLLEQQRPNVFQMNVGNILPGDRVNVELRYTELLVPEDGIYSFVYPAVVGPRYSNKREESASPSQRWQQNPYLHEGETAPFKTDIQVALNAGLPIQEIVSPTHKVDINFLAKDRAEVALNQAENNPGSRDYILNYRLTGSQIQNGTLLFQGEKENFFLTMIQPPQRVQAAEMPGREYIFIVDVSGSMYGFPLDTAKALLRDLIGRLRPADSFNVLLFAGCSSLLSEKSLAANPANVPLATAFIDKQQGGGGTELLPALQRALRLPRSEGTARSVIVVTDGYVDVEAEAFQLIRENLGKASLFAFGIGSSVNRHLIEGMARAGAGEPFVVLRPEEAASAAGRFRRYIESPVLTNIEIAYAGFEAYDIEPASVPDVFAERPLILFGKWRGDPKGTISIRGKRGSEDYSSDIIISPAVSGADNSALRYLWARARLAMLGDFNSLQPTDERVREITSLGLAYSLMTAYTSFVAIDSEVRNTAGISTTVKQPLPLPEGVSNYAVGRMPLREAAANFTPHIGAATLPHQAFDGGTSKGEEKIKAADESPETVPEEHAAVFRQCYQSAYPEAGIELDITISFLLDASGKASLIRIVSSDANSAMRQCLIQAAAKLVFKNLRAGKKVYRLSFGKQGELKYR